MIMSHWVLTVMEHVLRVVARVGGLFDAVAKAHAVHRQLFCTGHRHNISERIASWPPFSSPGDTAIMGALLSGTHKESTLAAPSTARVPNASSDVLGRAGSETISNTVQKINAYHLCYNWHICAILSCDCIP